jgi:hypothetical protein
MYYRLNSLGGNMKKIALAVAAVALFGMMIAGAPREAKADGGVVVASVAAYLVVDAIVGKECHMRAWPLNVITKVAHELRGYHACDRHRHHHRHHRHHRHH